MGGGIATDVSRRLLLNQFTDSGRYHLDIEELIGNKKINQIESIESPILKESLTQSEMESIVLKLNIPIDEHRITPTESQIQLMVEAATKAPSGGNAQAWKWYYSKGNLYLFHDISRSESLLDFDQLASYISFGAATENLILKSHEINLNPELILFPLTSEPRVICQFVFLKEKFIATKNSYDHLVSEIETRLTNRTISERKQIAPNVLEELKQVASSIDGAQLKIIDSIDEIEKIAHIVSSVERLRMMHKRGHSDFVNEIRWTDEENELKRDGIDLNILDINATAKAGLVVAKNWEVINTLKNWGKGSVFGKLSNVSVLSSSAMCLITMPAYSPINYFNAGRSLQRTWLTANKLNISLQPLSAATFFFARLIKGNGEELDNDTQKELKQLREVFLNVMKLDSIATNDIFLFKLSIANQPKIKALRRKLEDVLIYE
jgi:hypothetical protein